MTANQVLTASSFSDPDAEDTHQASQWQVSTASGSYGSPVLDSGADSGHLTSYTLSGSLLSSNTAYYWRVRYQDNHNAWSGWSSEKTFSTAGGSASGDSGGTEGTGGTSGEDDSTSTSTTGSAGTGSTGGSVSSQSGSASSPKSGSPVSFLSSYKCSTELKILHLSDGRIFLSWQAIDSAVEYRLYKQIEKEKQNLLVSLEPSETNYLDESKFSQKQTSYVLKAVDAQAKEVSCATAVVPANPPDNCPDLSAPKFNPSSSQIEIVMDENSRGQYVKERKIAPLDLSWQLPDASLKQVYLYRQGKPIIILDPGDSSYQDSDLADLTSEEVKYEIWTDYDLSQQGNPAGCLIPFDSQTVILKGAVEPCSDIISPQSGEIWYSGKDYSVRWSQPEKQSRAYAWGESFTVKLSLNQGKSFDFVLAKDLSFSTQSSGYNFEWKKIPSKYVSDRAQIKVSLLDNSGVEICQRRQNFKIALRGGIIARLSQSAGLSAAAATGAIIALNLGLVTAANGIMNSAVSTPIGSLLGQTAHFFQSFPGWLMGLMAWRRRRRQNWGTVMSQIDSKPLKGALVQLHQQQFGRVVKTLLTDAQGRFWFLISSPGQYFISVQKPGFKKFISQGFGIKDIEKLPLGQKVLLKPVRPEENSQLVKALAVLFRIFAVLEKIRLPLLIVGTVSGIIGLILSPGLWQYLIMLFYLILWIIEVVFYLVPRPFGQVFSEGKTAAMAIVRAIKTEQPGRPSQTYVTDRLGRFHFLLSQGDYQFKVTKLGHQPFISPAYQLKKLNSQPNFKFQIKKVYPGV